MSANEGMHVNISTLMECTDWERHKWHAWLRKHGDPVLKTSSGEHGDGRFQTIGDYVKHIFSAEKRYVDRLSGRPLTDTTSLPSDNIETLFDFGRRSRNDFKRFVADFAAAEWDAPGNSIS